MAKGQANKIVISKALPKFCQDVLAMANDTDITNISEAELAVLNGAIYGMLSVMKGADRLALKNSFRHAPKEPVKEVTRPSKRLPRPSEGGCTTCDRKTFGSASELLKYLDSPSLMKKAYERHGLAYDSSLNDRRLSLSLFNAINGILIVA